MVRECWNFSNQKIRAVICYSNIFDIPQWIDHKFSLKRNGMSWRNDGLILSHVGETNYSFPNW